MTHLLDDDPPFNALEWRVLRVWSDPRRTWDGISLDDHLHGTTLLLERDWLDAPVRDTVPTPAGHAALARWRAERDRRAAALDDLMEDDADDL